MIITPTTAGTVIEVKQQIRKYVDYFKAKTHPGVEGLDKSIRSAYAKSMILYFLPPLVAIGALTLADVSQLVASLGKSVDGVQKAVPNRAYNSLEEGVANGTIAQVMSAANKLKAFIRKDNPVKPNIRVEREADEVAKIINNTCPTKKADMSPAEKAHYDLIEEKNKIYLEKKAKYTLSDQQKHFVWNMLTGKPTDRHFATL